MFNIWLSNSPHKRKYCVSNQDNCRFIDYEMILHAHFLSFFVIFCNFFSRNFSSFFFIIFSWFYFSCISFCIWKTTKKNKIRFCFLKVLWNVGLFSFSPFLFLYLPLNRFHFIFPCFCCSHIVLWSFPSALTAQHNLFSFKIWNCLQIMFEYRSIIIIICMLIAYFSDVLNWPVTCLRFILELRAAPSPALHWHCSSIRRLIPILRYTVDYCLYLFGLL